MLLLMWLDVNQTRHRSYKREGLRARSLGAHRDDIEWHGFPHKGCQTPQIAHVAVHEAAHVAVLHLQDHFRARPPPPPQLLQHALAQPRPMHLSA